MRMDTAFALTPFLIALELTDEILVATVLLTFFSNFDHYGVRRSRSITSHINILPGSTMSFGQCIASDFRTDSFLVYIDCVSSHVLKTFHFFSSAPVCLVLSKCCA